MRYTGTGRRKKNVQLSSPGDYLQKILGATDPSGKKLQFPYEIPPIVIDMSPKMTNTLIIISATLAGGAIASVVVNRLLK